MLSRVFNQHILSVLITLFLPLVIGCGSKTVDLRVPADHPAHPDTPEGFDGGHDISNAEMPEADGGHGRVKLSLEGTAALVAMLDAYFAIGARLGSDTMEGVNTKADTMLEAFDTLEGESAAELRRSDESHTKTVRATGQQLSELSDIKAARIAYGSLSASFQDLIAAVGIPASYDKGVYSYVCGMAPDVPEAGIWLQAGGSVRNPYFGSAMLGCHIAKVQLSVASSEMSGSPEMESHKHSH